MENKLKELLENGKTSIRNAKTQSQLQEIKAKLLGKESGLGEIMKLMPTLSKEEKGKVGKLANEVKIDLNDLFKNKGEEIMLAEFAIDENFDTSTPGFDVLNGGLHPITQMCYDLNDTFRSLGFEIFPVSDITSELSAFDNLNFKKNHPARESMDTYWIKGFDEYNEEKSRLCLRPHLTGESVKYLQNHKPPYRFVYPGRVFRNESTDAKHERAFFQYEVLILDKEFNFSSGKVLIQSILSKIFGKHVPVRMRAGFFPFVEPGFEIDMQCQVCQGKGCSVCKQVGWIEIMPGGIPHPNVLKSAGIENNQLSGFYVNIGLDRLVMMRYGIDDVRNFHSGDLRFLNQFN